MTALIIRNTSIPRLRVLFLLIFTLFTIHGVLSESNLTEYIVCNTSHPYYDPCVCALAESNAVNLTCFGQLVCPYDESNGFCSDRGYCDFTESKCECDDGYGNRDGDNDCNHKYDEYEVPDALSITMMAFSILLFIAAIGLMLWVHKYREVSDVKAMSVVFTHLTLVGCASMCIGTLFISIGYSDSTCVILEWFQFNGICIVLTCAALKSYRIASIFGSDNFTPSDLSDGRLLRYFCSVLVINVLLLSLYTVFNSLNGGAYMRYKKAKLRSEVRCNSDLTTLVTYYLLVAWQLLILLFVLNYGSKTRSAGKIFKETKCIYIGSQIGTICFISWGIFVLFTTDYLFQIAVRGYGTLLVVVMIITLLFKPKMEAVYRNHEGVAEHAEDQMKRQYEASVKDPNGKELLLLLDAVVRELAYRTKHNMLQIELESVDLSLLDRLLGDVRDLMPTTNAVDGGGDSTDVNDTATKPDIKKLDTIDVPDRDTSNGSSNLDTPRVDAEMSAMIRLDSKSHTGPQSATSLIGGMTPDSPDDDRS